MDRLFNDSQQNDSKLLWKREGKIRVKIYNTIPEYLGSE
jgi:hypothetical protein